MGAEPITTKKERKTLQDIISDPLSVEIATAFLHQGAMVPLGGIVTTLSQQRIPGIKFYLHPVYGYVGDNKGKLFHIPTANIIIGCE